MSCSTSAAPLRATDPRAPGSRGATARRRHPCREGRPSPRCAPTSARPTGGASSSGRPRRPERALPHGQRGTRTNHSLSSMRAAARLRQSGRPACRGSPRLRRGRSGPIPGELDERRLTELGVRPEQRSAPEAHRRVPSRRREPGAARAGASSSSPPRPSSAARDPAAALEQDVDRPVVPDVTERVDRSRSNARIRIIQNTPDQARHGRMVSAFEALERVYAAPTTPFRARPTSHTSTRR